jgi:leader peptidase (prepilin peptidase)/N-methyltransferase
MIALYALLGLALGVGINALADQLPRWRRVRRAPFCAACEAPRPLWAWSGALAYVGQGGRCPQCGQGIPWRQPLVEVGTAALFGFLWYRYGLAGEWRFLLLYSVYSAILVLVLVIDLEHKLILNVVMYPAWGVALLGSLVHPTDYYYRLALLGWVAGFGLLFLIYLLGEVFVKVMSRMRGRDINAVAFGFGDVRLGGFMGLVLGFPEVLSAIFLAIFLGGLVGMAYWFVQAVVLKRYSLFTAIPYGPFLVAGTMVLMFFGPL